MHHIEVNNGSKDHNQESNKDIVQSQTMHSIKYPVPLKVSSNFEAYIPPKQKDNQPLDPVVPKETTNEKTKEKANLVVNSKLRRNQIPAPLPPPPPTVVQSSATRLRSNQAKNETPINISPPKITTKQGFPDTSSKRSISWVNWLLGANTH